MPQTKRDINKDFLSRELAAELQLPLSVVNPIVERVFLKIMKHLMRGRIVGISGFGRFYLRFVESKECQLFGKETIVAGPRFIPAFKFSRTAMELIKESNNESAKRREKNERR